MVDLFAAPHTDTSDANHGALPLAERLRPHSLSDVIGQDHLLKEDGLLNSLVGQNQMPSLIFWGPPGCGKTTLARILVQEIFKNPVHSQEISAIFSGVADLKDIFVHAKNRQQNQVRTILFVDEIHRFNKSQQDSFLPHLETGLITLIGATTENPSFELNAALLSRCRVLTLNSLNHESLFSIYHKAKAQNHILVSLSEDILQFCAELAQGDARYFIGLLEQLDLARSPNPSLAQAEKILQRKKPLYDKSADGHYNLISALHKSVRGSDPDASLYWFCRMLDAGEDPRFIGRRLVRMASEDIGLAEPTALAMTIAACDAYERLGSPEGELMLAQAILFLASAPKSNAVYVAYKAAQKMAVETGHLSPPKIILNAPTQLMRDQHYGQGYIYDPDTKDGFSGQNYFPDGLTRSQFYKPVARGFERDIQKRLEYWQKLRDEKNA
jgi:putative ATPase